MTSAIEAARARLENLAVNGATGNTQSPGVAAGQALGAQGSTVLDLSSEKPKDPVPEQFPQEQVSAAVAVARVMGLREFQHVYAGANTIMPDGTKIVFGGAFGNFGRYITSNKDEIDFLEKLSRTSGTQITEVKHDATGRELAVGASIGELAADMARAASDASLNARLDVDPAVTAARANLGAQIRTNS